MIWDDDTEGGVVRMPEGVVASRGVMDKKPAALESPNYLLGCKRWQVMGHTFMSSTVIFSRNNSVSSSSGGMGSPSLSMLSR